MLKKVLLGIALVVGIFLVVVALQPNVLVIERKATLHAPADIVYDQVANFHNWKAWSPWEKLDPTMVKNFSGPEAGVGAVYAWDSTNKDVGTGRMTIVDAKQNERLGLELEFLKPWQAKNPTVFTFASAGTDTTVTWKMNGEKNFIMKAVCMFMDADAMVGKDFDNGLAALGAASEAVAKERAAKTSAVIPVEVAPASADNQTTK